MNNVLNLENLSIDNVYATSVNGSDNFLDLYIRDYGKVNGILSAVSKYRINNQSLSENLDRPLGQNLIMGILSDISCRERDVKIHSISALSTLITTLGGEVIFITKRKTINVTSEDINKGNVTGGGEYDVGDYVRIKATPNTNYKFDNWNNDITLSDNEMTIEIKDDMITEYKAYFSEDVSEHVFTVGNQSFDTLQEALNSDLAKTNIIKQHMDYNVEAEGISLSNNLSIDLQNNKLDFSNVTKTYVFTKPSAASSPIVSLNNGEIILSSSNGLTLVKEDDEVNIEFNHISSYNVCTYKDGDTGDYHMIEAKSGSLTIKDSYFSAAEKLAGPVFYSKAGNKLQMYNSTVDMSNNRYTNDNHAYQSAVSLKPTLSAIIDNCNFLPSYNALSTHFTVYIARDSSNAVKATFNNCNIRGGSRGAIAATSTNAELVINGENTLIEGCLATQTNTNSAITINDGTFKSFQVKKIINDKSEPLIDATYYATLKGGTYKGVDPTTAQGRVADGYKCVQSGDDYIVIPE